MANKKAPEQPAAPRMPWPPDWLICACGEAVKRETIDDHQCRPKHVRPPMLYARWLDKKTRAEILEELRVWGLDPAFRPEAQQQDFYQP